MRINIWIKSNEVSELFQNFRHDNERWKKFKKYVIGSMSHKAKEEVRQMVRQDFPQAENQNPRYSDKMIDAALVEAGEPYINGDYVYRFIHVLGVRDKKSGTYRLRFFNAQSEGNPNIKKYANQRWIDREENKFVFEKDAQEALENYVKYIENNR